MAATVASKPGLIQGVGQDSNSMDTAAGADIRDIHDIHDDAGPKVPPQHKKVKLTDFNLIRTLGTGMSSHRLLFLSFFSPPFPLSLVANMETLSLRIRNLCPCLSRPSSRRKRAR